ACLAAILFSACRREDMTNSSDPARETSLLSRLISELFGTFMLALTVGLNIVVKSTATAWSAGAALMCMVYALGDVSGAHFNPAVTTAVVLSGRGKCPLDRGLCYCAVQLGAAQMAGVILGQIASGPGEVFSLGPQGHFLWPAVFAAELAFTFLLAFVVLAVATTRLPHSPSKQHFHFGLSIGGCVTMWGSQVASLLGPSLVEC
ncbi:unnamed protein product, partial [Polarella glacialis]